jgi:serine/threonine protein kinase
LESARKFADNEVAVYKVLQENKKHENILKCIEVATCPPGYVSLVLEFCSGGDLFDLLAYHHHRVTTTDAKSISFQIFDGLKFMHDRLVVHRDIKLENVGLLLNNIAFFALIRILKVSTHDIERCRYCC